VIERSYGLPYPFKIDTDILAILSGGPGRAGDILYVLGIGRRSRQRATFDRADRRLRDAGLIALDASVYPTGLVITDAGRAELARRRSEA
jgi:hypothetical protein